MSRGRHAAILAALFLTAATPGTYYYVCQVPGHAQDGMYGKIVID